MGATQSPPLQGHDLVLELIDQIRVVIPEQVQAARQVLEHGDRARPWVCSSARQGHLHETANHQDGEAGNRHAQPRHGEQAPENAYAVGHGSPSPALHSEHEA